MLLVFGPILARANHYRIGEDIVANLYSRDFEDALKRARHRMWVKSLR